MRYRVEHVTRYAYGSPVELAAHMVHLRPRPQFWQSVVSERILTAPMPARRRDGLDHFGNHVTWLFLDLPHADFQVTSEAVVDVDCPAPPAPSDTLGWENVVQASREAAGWQAVEFQFGTPMAPVNADTRDYVAKSFPPGRTILEGLLDLNERFYSDFKFRSGVTTISTPVSQVMHRREGVCQDFAHGDGQRPAGDWHTGALHLRLYPHQAAAGPNKAQGCRSVTCLGRCMDGSGARVDRSRSDERDHCQRRTRVVGVGGATSAMSARCAV